MNYFKKLTIPLFCSIMIGIVSISPAFAAVTEKYTKSAQVTGGKITAYATYYASGDKRWSVTWSHLLSDYNNTKSSGVKTTREWKTENEYIVGGQLYKVDWSYNTINLGQHTFTFNR